MLGYSLIYRVVISDRDKHVFGGLVWRGGVFADGR